MAVGQIYGVVYGNDLYLTNDPGLSADYRLLDQTTSQAVPWLGQATRAYINGTIQPLSTSNWFRGITTTTINGINRLDMSYCTDCSYMFSGCENLRYLNGINGNMSNVTSMKHMFSGCEKLTSISNMQNGDVSKVEDFEETFNRCSSLTSLPVDNWNTSSATTMKDMFSNCSSVDTLNVSNFNTSNVTNMSGMFRNVNAALDVSGFDTSNCTDMSYMFFHSMISDRIQSLDLTNWKTSNVTTTESMFYNCKSLKDVYVSMNGDMSNVTQSDDMFLGCESIVGDGGVKYNFNNANDVTYARPYKGYLKGVALPNTYNGGIRNGLLEISSNYVMGYPGGGFYKDDQPVIGPGISGNPGYAKFLDEVIPASFNQGFRNCASLGAIDFTNLNLSNITDLSYAFMNTGFNEVDFNDLDLSNINNIVGMFMGCDSLVSVKNMHFDSITDLTDLFNGCSSLPVLNFAGVDMSNITKMDRMFKDCSGLFKIFADGAGSASSSTDMFLNDTNLFGTIKYDPSITDITGANFEHYFTKYVDSFALSFGNATSEGTDGVDIDNDYIVGLSMNTKPYGEYFSIGNTVCNKFELSVVSTAYTRRPEKVGIFIDDSVYLTAVLDYSMDDDNFITTFTLTDNMIYFNTELTETGTINEILTKICQSHGFSLVNGSLYLGDFTVTKDHLKDKPTERDLISYVAEVNGTYAYINPSGNLQFDSYNTGTGKFKTPVATIDMNMCSSFQLGSRHIIDRVCYETEDSQKSYPAQSENETLYLNSGNFLLKQNTDAVLEHIHSVIDGYTFWNVKINNCPISAAIRCCQLIQVTDGTSYGPFICTIDYDYNHGGNGGYEIILGDGDQVETSVPSLGESITTLRNRTYFYGIDVENGIQVNVNATTNSYTATYDCGVIPNSARQYFIDEVRINPGASPVVVAPIPLKKGQTIRTNNTCTLTIFKLKG